MTVTALYDIICILKNMLWEGLGMQYQYNILEISKDCEFVFFECSNGDYGVLEPQNCEIAVGDILQPLNTRDLPCCGVQSLLLNGRKQVKVYIDDLNFKEEAYKLFKQYSK